jgi:hypothetical protein
VVDVALDHRGERLDPAEGLLLARRPDGAQQGLRVAEDSLEAGDIGGVDVAQAGFEGGGVDLEPADVLVDQILEAGPDVGAAEDGVVGDLVQADPQSQVVGGQAPLSGEGVEVGRHDE